MVKVLYIAGWLRSGTTVISNVLGSTARAVNIGELNYLWMKEHPTGFVCGCGRILWECPLWRPVLSQIHMSREARYEVRTARRAQWSNSDVRARYREWRRGRIDPTYSQALGRVYHALVERSGADLVVDSTKNPADGLAAALAPGVDLHLLHVVRDPRAAAYSGMSAKVHGANASGNPMVEFSPGRNTFHWGVRNVLIERYIKPVLGSGRYLRVRYEDLMAAPRSGFEQVADWAGISPSGLPFSDEQTVQVATSHTVMGNPNRHTADQVLALRTDSRWVQGLPRRDAWGVSVLAAPLMARYGYPLSPRHAATRERGDA